VLIDACCTQLCLVISEVTGQIPPEVHQISVRCKLSRIIAAVKLCNNIANTYVAVNNATIKCGNKCRCYFQGLAHFISPKNKDKSNLSNLRLSQYNVCMVGVPYGLLWLFLPLLSTPLVPCKHRHRIHQQQAERVHSQESIVIQSGLQPNVLQQHCTEYVRLLHTLPSLSQTVTPAASPNY